MIYIFRKAFETLKRFLFISTDINKNKVNIINLQHKLDLEIFVFLRIIVHKKEKQKKVIEMFSFVSCYIFWLDNFSFNSLISCEGLIFKALDSANTVFIVGFLFPLSKRLI